jgi:hypothetical protein
MPGTPNERGVKKSFPANSQDVLHMPRGSHTSRAKTSMGGREDDSVYGLSEAGHFYIDTTNSQRQRRSKYERKALRGSGAADSMI